MNGTSNRHNRFMAFALVLHSCTHQAHSHPTCKFSSSLCFVAALPFSPNSTMRPARASGSRTASTISLTPTSSVLDPSSYYLAALLCVIFIPILIYYAWKFKKASTGSDAILWANRARSDLDTVNNKQKNKIKQTTKQSDRSSIYPSIHPSFLSVWRVVVVLLNMDEIVLYYQKGSYDACLKSCQNALTAGESSQLNNQVKAVTKT